MKPVRTNTALAALILAVLALLTMPSMAQVNRATFPENFDEYVLYATYDRGSSGEEAFALPETIEIAKAGLPLPPGTRLVLSILKNDALTGYFVMEKGQDWGLDFAEEQRTGDWHFQEFNTEGQVSQSAFAERCQSCHQGAAADDFMFTIDRMREYLP